jgi:RecA/RadA recombinase
VRSLSEIQSTRTEWLYEKRIPVGGVSLLAGMPGQGKTTWLCQLASMVTLGSICEPSNVLFATAEDSVDKTIKPRMVAANANLDRVYFIDAVVGDDETVTGSFRLPSDADLLAEQVEVYGAKLLVIDPLMAHLDAKLESAKDESMRQALSPLRNIAEQLNIAIVVAHHLNKREGTDPLMRIGGSLGGIVGPVRSILLWGDDKANDEQRLLVHIKNNGAPEQHTQVYSLEGTRVKLDDGSYDEVGKTVLVGEDTRGAEAVFGGDGSRAGALDDAIEFLVAELADGELEAEQLLKDAEKSGLSEYAVRKAAKVLGIKKKLDGSPRHGGKWVWSLPLKITVNRRSRGDAKGEA